MLQKFTNNGYLTLGLWGFKISPETQDKFFTRGLPRAISLLLFGSYTERMTHIRCAILNAEQVFEFARVQKSVYQMALHFGVGFSEMSQILEDDLILADAYERGCATPPDPIEMVNSPPWEREPKHHCYRCKTTKPLSAFPIKATNVDGLTHVCDECLALKEVAKALKQASAKAEKQAARDATHQRINDAIDLDTLFKLAAEGKNEQTIAVAFGISHYEFKTAISRSPEFSQTLKGARETASAKAAVAIMHARLEKDRPSTESFIDPASVRSLSAQGFSLQNIAHALGVSKATLKTRKRTSFAIHTAWSEGKKEFEKVKLERKEEARLRNIAERQEAAQVKLAEIADTLEKCCYRCRDFKPVTDFRSIGPYEFSEECLICEGDTDEKRCERCNAVKHKCLFHLNKRTTDGYASICAKCFSEDVSKHPMYELDRRRRQATETPKEYKINRITNGAISRARENGLPCDITVDFMLSITPDACPVFGTPFDYSSFQNGILSETSPSIDQFIPRLGYTKGNVEVISMKANTLKSYGSREDHIRIAEWMKEREEVMLMLQ